MKTRPYADVDIIDVIKPGAWADEAFERVRRRLTQTPSPQGTAPWVVVATYEVPAWKQRQLVAPPLKRQRGPAPIRIDDEDFRRQLIKAYHVVLARHPDLEPTCKEVAAQMYMSISYFYKLRRRHGCLAWPPA